MRKLRLKFSENFTFEINLPGGNKPRIDQEGIEGRQKLLNWTRGFGFWTLMLGTIFFGFLYQWSPNFSSEIPFLLIAWIFILLGVALTGVVLAGWRFLVDPSLFVQILVFALLVISAYLFVPLSDRIGNEFIGANTFGVSPVKYLAGLYIMGFVGLFYFAHLFINTGKRLNHYATGLVAGLLLAVAISLTSEVLGVSLNIVAIISFPVFFNYLIFGGKNQWIAIGSLLGLVLAGINIFSHVFSFGVIISVLISLVVTLLINLQLQNWEIKSPVGTIRNSIKKYLNSEQKALDILLENAIPLLIAALTGWFIVTFSWVFANRAELGEIITSLKSAYSNIFIFLPDWQSKVVGIGATLSPRSTTMATIILYQGAIGFLAYLMIWTTSLYALFRAVIREYKAEAEQMLSLVVSPIIIMVPILGLFTRIDFTSIVLWWVAFSYVAVSSSLKSEGLITGSISRLKIWRFSLEKKLVWLQLALITGIIFFTIYVIPFLRDKLI